MTKLTWEKVADIRSCAPTMRNREIAERYGITDAYASSIITNHAWYDPDYEKEERHLRPSRKISQEAIDDILDAPFEISNLVLSERHQISQATVAKYRRDIRIKQWTKNMKIWQPRDLTSKIVHEVFNEPLDISNRDLSHKYSLSVVIIGRIRRGFYQNLKERV